VDGEGTVEFVTKQVAEITELMKLYIAEVTLGRHVIKYPTGMSPRYRKP
jgi:hypothetical protein